MKMWFSVTLCFLWYLVRAQLQTDYPFVTFMGENLPNNSYIDLTLVGEVKAAGVENIVRCNTDLDTCCGSMQGDHRGDWYFPNGTIVEGPENGTDIYRRRGDQRVNLLRRNNASSPSGIYHCNIPTIALYDNFNTVGDAVYVGLYANGGKECQ